MGDQPYRSMATPEEIEVARTQAFLAQAELRLPRIEMEPGTVASFDFTTHLAGVTLDSDIGSEPRVCFSIVDDVAPGERVYVQHHPPHTALIVGRAAPAVQTPFDFAIQAGAGFSLGNLPVNAQGGTQLRYEASFSKRGAMCDVRWNVVFGTSGCAPGLGRWAFMLPVAVARSAFTTIDRWVSIGSGTMYLANPSPVIRNFQFTAAPGDVLAYGWRDGNTYPLGGGPVPPNPWPDPSVPQAVFPGNDGAFTSNNGGFMAGKFSYPTD